MKTIGKNCQIQFEEKKSKFIGTIKAVYSKEEAEQFIAFMKYKYPTATHNCSAYSIKYDGKEFFKVDDDGEPSGTAGKPIGDILQYMGVQNVVMVVTRYFGGVKLGAGGLIRNYAKCCKLAVQEAGIVDFVKKDIWTINFPYDKQSEVDQIGGRLIDSSYLDRVTYRIELTEEQQEKLKRKTFWNRID